MPNESKEPYDSIYGEGGIRTRETVFPSTRFPSVRLRPLGHLSINPKNNYTGNRVSVKFTNILQGNLRKFHPKNIGFCGKIATLFLNLPGMSMTDGCRKESSWDGKLGRKISNTKSLLIWSPMMSSRMISRSWIETLSATYPIY